MANGKGLLSQGQKEQALYKGLLQLGAQLSAGSGGNRPVSTLQALSQGGAGFADAYGQSVDKSKNRAIQQREMDYQDEVRKRESDKLASQAAYRMSLPPSVRQQAEVMGIPQFAAAEFARSQMPVKETFETVENPFGKGGIYQKSSTTGKMTPVYTPPKATKPTDFDRWLKANPDKNFNDYLAATKTSAPSSSMKEYEALKEEGSFTGTFKDYLKGLQQQEIDYAQALSGAKIEAEKAEDVKAKSKIYETFDIGLSNVSDALQETTTGPYIGKLPALTEEAQTAEGAVAIMAPLLKSLFRQSGEGTFTDKDQELLMKMVPTRDDLPAAAASKINMIKSVVRSKLGLERLPSDEELQIKSTMPQSATDMGVDPDVWGAMTEEERSLFE